MFEFKKLERISSRKTIQQLYHQGITFKTPPFRVGWMVSENNNDPYPAEVLITVSKKNFKRAVDRNRIKRLTKEAYRKHKHELYNYLSAKNVHLCFFINYANTTILSYQEIERAVVKIIEKLKAINYQEFQGTGSSPLPPQG